MAKLQGSLFSRLHCDAVRCPPFNGHGRPDPWDRPNDSGRGEADRKGGPPRPTNGNGRTATPAQIKAVHSIANQLELDGELTRMIQRECNVSRVEALTVKECSDLITELQRRQKEVRR